MVLIVQKKQHKKEILAFLSFQWRVMQPSALNGYKIIIILFHDPSHACVEMDVRKMADDEITICFIGQLWLNFEWNQAPRL